MTCVKLGKKEKDIFKLFSQYLTVSAMSKMYFQKQLQTRKLIFSIELVEALCIVEKAKFGLVLWIFK